LYRQLSRSDCIFRPSDQTDPRPGRNREKKRQKEDGSWANDNKAFMETNPDLATAYALLALSYCKAGKK
jgi:hypothetical protein